MRYFCRFCDASNCAGIVNWPVESKRCREHRALGRGLGLPNANVVAAFLRLRAGIRVLAFFHFGFRRSSTIGPEQTHGDMGTGESLRNCWVSSSERDQKRPAIFGGSIMNGNAL
jgi:hypothetical protein